MKRTRKRRKTTRPKKSKIKKGARRGRMRMTMGY